MGKFILLIVAVAVIGGMYLVQQHFAALPLEESYIKADNISSPTIEEVEGGVKLNFELCQKMQQTVTVAFGSTTIQVTGKKGSNCQMNYGGEVENPKWDGKLTTSCLVPINQGIQIFPLTNYGVNFDTISQYCTAH